MKVDNMITFPLTDDEMVSSCLTAVKAFCKNRRHLGSFDADKCVDAAISEFKAQYRKARGYRKSSAMKPEHLREMDLMYGRLRDVIEDGAREISLGFATKHKTLEITKTTADAYIKASMAEAGFKSCSVICQCYRAKVTVTLPSRYKAMFIVKYKDIMAGKMEEQVAMFISLTEKVESLPFTIKIWK